MKAPFLFLSAFFFLCLSVVGAQACGRNTPEDLAKRSKEIFDRWDVDKNGVLDLAEFWGANGFMLGDNGAPPAVVAFYTGKVQEAEEYKNADTDEADGLSYMEWRKVRPDSGFALKGCGD